MEFSFAKNDNKLMPKPESHLKTFDPKPLLETGRKWSRWLGPLISFAVLVAIVVTLSKLSIVEIVSLVPRTPYFWLVFLIGYFVCPVTDWIIFRRLWHIPFSGILALVRKQITNALLPSYSGEVYFYAWARRRTELTGTPFGAIKDVAILSALTGNIVTLVMLALAYPLFGKLLDEAGFASQAHYFAISIGFVTASSLVMMIFRGRLFSLPNKDLVIVSFIVLARIIISTFATALLWHIAMPDVSLNWWLLLATIKLLLSRLPFVPNQDGLFASVAVIWIGHDHMIAALVAMVASVGVVTHLIIGTILGISDVVQSGVEQNA